MKNSNIDDFTLGFGRSSIPSGQYVKQIKKLLLKEFMDGAFVGINSKNNETKMKLAINKAIINLYNSINEIELD